LREKIVAEKGECTTGKSYRINGSFRKHLGGQIEKQEAPAI